MAKVGALGLPLHFVSSETSAQRQAVYQSFGLPSVEAFQRKLLADTRFQAIKDRQLSRAGGASSILQDHDICAWWAWRANEKGLEVADAEFETFLVEDEIETLFCAWIYGIQFPRSEEIAKDIFILPIDMMPYSEEKVEFRNASIHGPGRLFPFPQSALVTKIRHPKIQDKPRVDAIVERVVALPLLLNLLHNVHASACCYCSYIPDHIPPGNWGGGGSSSPIPDIISRRETIYQNSENIDLDALLDAYLSKSADESRRVRLALERLQAAKGRSYAAANQALDLGICLESILLSDRRAEQISLLFRLRGALYAGDNPADRRALYKTLSDIYTIRSDVAHSGTSSKLTEPEPYYNRLSHHFHAAERILRKIIISGPPDWEELLLGK